MNQGLAGRTALVTGAGRGIGRAVAEALSQAGARLIAVARTKVDIEELAIAMNRAGGDARAVVCDVSDVQAATRLHEQAGAVDILVNNVGWATGGSLLKTDERQWQQAFDRNVTTTYRMLQLFLPGMMERRWGRVVNVASILSKTAYPHAAAYVMAKHALLGLTRAAAAETWRHGVTVNAVCPGYVDTPATLANAASIASLTGRDRDDVLAGFKKMNPQNRLIDPAEVAHAVLMFAAEAAGGVTGQGLNIDGGSVFS